MESALASYGNPIAKERSTGTLYILSPFSGEKTASCQLVEKNGRFYDYSTGELGNKVEFVLWTQNHTKDITAESLETTEKVFKKAQNLTS